MLGSDAQADQFEQLLEHVEVCSRCQARLEELAADSHQWTQATHLLSGFSSNQQFRESYRTQPLQHGLPNNAGVAWTESMARQLLSPASHPEMLGRIGRYEVERLIGSGGMGIVFKAIDTELNRPVAIKILAPYLAGNGAARQRFAREAQAAAAVVHEHVVPIHNVETDGQSPFLVMRYVAGESLQARLDREGSQDVCQVLRIGMQVAAGLSAAHAQGLVHRDIKPSNILVESGVDRSLLTDFGLARAADDASLTNTGYHPGTPQYMSPEQARGDAMDTRSDLFSLGSVMYTMCTGRAPFRAETSYGVLRRITDTQPRDIRELNPLVPGWLCAIIGKMMCKDATGRFQSAAQLEQLLSACLSHLQRPSANPLPREVVELESQQSRQAGRLSKLPVVFSWQMLGLAIVLIALLYQFWPGQTNSQISSQPSAEFKADGNSKGSMSSQGGSSNPPIDVNASKKATAPLPPSPASLPRSSTPPSAADRLRAKLSERITVNLQQVSLNVGLQEILAEPAITHRLNLISFTDQNVDLNQPSSLAADGRLSSVLQRFCNSYEATYIVHESEIEIVSTSYASSHPVLRYYDLSEVLPSNRQVGSVMKAVNQMAAEKNWASAGGAFTSSVVDSWLIVGASERVHLELERMLSQLVFAEPFIVKE
jgi:serine/threonine protein kinase